MQKYKFPLDLHSKIFFRYKNHGVNNKGELPYSKRTSRGIKNYTENYTEKSTGNKLLPVETSHIITSKK